MRPSFDLASIGPRIAVDVFENSRVYIVAGYEMNLCINPIK